MYLGGLIVVDDSGEETPEDTYTLPVEVFESTVPVVVSRPEPVLMPISTDLGYTEPQTFLSNSLFSWMTAAVVSSVLLSGASRRRRKRAA